MSAWFIDRRQDGKNKGAVNRQRFIRRYKKQIRDSFTKTLEGRSIQDIDEGGRVNIPARDLSEPVFGHGTGGRREVVHPGNREYLAGDRVSRPQRGGGGGSGGGNPSDSGDGEDDFTFELSREEFLEMFFEGLELPFLVKKQLATISEWRSVRAGFVSHGSPNSMDIRRTFERAFGRRLAIGGARKEDLERLEADRKTLLEEGISLDDERLVSVLRRIENLLLKSRPAFIEPLYDLRFRNRMLVPKPSVQAVMFCIMDVSGSMDRNRKDLAKRFFTLLYLFLKRNYEKIDVVFIRHHTAAKEVDEQEFFYGKETGGTIVSNALKLWRDIVKERYSTDIWNIYVAQASDGDNWHLDSPECAKILSAILPMIQYYAYVEILSDKRGEVLWKAYEEIQPHHPNFAMRSVDGPECIYPVFRDLFSRKRLH